MSLDLCCLGLHYSLKRSRPTDVLFKNVSRPGNIILLSLCLAHRKIAQLLLDWPWPSNFSVLSEAKLRQEQCLPPLANSGLQNGFGMLLLKGSVQGQDNNISYSFSIVAFILFVSL